MGGFVAKFPGGFSPKTLTTVASRPVRDINDLYPDRAATPTSGGGATPGVYPLKDTGSTPRLSEEVPKVSYDMNKLFTWQFGDVVRGDHAKAHKGMKNYINDISKSWGAENAYKHIFIDTFRPIKPQIDEFKFKGRRRTGGRR